MKHIKLFDEHFDPAVYKPIIGYHGTCASPSCSEQRNTGDLVFWHIDDRGRNRCWFCSEECFYQFKESIPD